MSEDLVAKVSSEIERIQALELAAQPDEFAKLRELLEQALDSVDQYSGN